MLHDFMKDQDVYIKDEGYAAVKFLSDKAKEIAESSTKFWRYFTLWEPYLE